MPLTLQPATRDDIPEWSAVCYTAGLAPHKPFQWVMVPPVPGLGLPHESAEQREQQIAGLTGLMEHGLWGIPNASHLKVVDSDTGKLIAGALYVVCPEWPEKDAEQPVAMWQPEGGQRAYATRVLQKNTLARLELINGPHVYMYIIFTAEPYRSRGVASMMMRAMTDVADAQHLPCWLESTELATHCYKKHGFEVVRTVDITPSPASSEEANDEGWKLMEKWMDGQRIMQYCMMRPAK